MHRRAALTASAALSIVLLGGTVAVAAVSGGGLLGFQHGASTQSAAVEPVGTAAADPAQQRPSGPSTTKPSVVVEVIEDRIVVRSVPTSPATSPVDARRVTVPMAPATIATPSTAPVSPRSWRDDDDDEGGDERHSNPHEDDDDHEDDD